MAQQHTPTAGSGHPDQQRPAAAWPFPPASGPVRWTRAQIVAHARQQREQAGEALL